MMSDGLFSLHLEAKIQVLELNFRNLDLTFKVTENDSVRNHKESIVFINQA